jgi:type II secretion system protein L
VNSSIETNMTLNQNDTEKTLLSVSIAVMPAEHVLLKEISYLQSERKHLAKTLPWTLEEQLVDDVEDLHIAVAIMSDDLAVAAIVRKELIKQKLYALQEEKTVAQALVPEQLLLPWQAGQWTAEIQQNGNRW